MISLIDYIKNITTSKRRTVFNESYEEFYNKTKKSYDEYIRQWSIFAAINSELDVYLKQKFDPYGIIIDTVNFTDISVDDETAAAIQKKVTAQQEMELVLGKYFIMFKENTHYIKEHIV